MLGWDTHVDQKRTLKGIIFKLNNVQKKYYENWAEKDKLVDMMATNNQITVSEIEKFIQTKRF
jgi:hypothetical protein